MKLSVVIPCKNEDSNIVNLYNRLSEELKNTKYELIVIDDGSTDDTLKILKELYKKDMVHIKIISFSRNFKKEAAMLAGLRHATGDYISIIDGDLQHNPKYLTEMMEFLDNNPTYDQVAMVMKKRKEKKFMVLCKKIFYKIINKLSDTHFEKDASDFRMFRKNVKDAIISLGEKNRFSKGIFSWVGFNTKYLEYDVEERVGGKSSFNFKNSLSYAIEGITSFSTKPLKWSIGLGLINILIAIVIFIIKIIKFFASSIKFSNFIILILLLLLISGVLFIMIGMIGLYVSQICLEVKGRPDYIIKEKIGFEENSIL